MGNTVCYQIFASSTGSGQYIANLTILRDGVIRAVCAHVNATSGVATGYALHSLTYNAGGVVADNVNDPSRQILLAALSSSSTAANVNISQNGPQTAVNKRVKVGDLVAASQTFGGTAYAACITRWLIWVEEAS